MKKVLILGFVVLMSAVLSTSVYAGGKKKKNPFARIHEKIAAWEAKIAKLDSGKH